MEIQEAVTLWIPATHGSLNEIHLSSRLFFIALKISVTPVELLPLEQQASYAIEILCGRSALHNFLAVVSLQNPLA
jgi:hypothetical protein